MMIEHVAFQHPDPIGAADWYGKNFQMKVVRESSGPSKCRFLADANGKTILEIYDQSAAAPMPDYPTLSPFNLHIAFGSADIAVDVERLVANGAKLIEAPNTIASGDQLAMLRDPWGVPVQLVKRAKPLL
jgi:predicted enzyme related to lactoylglutathione lyase